MGSKEVIKAKVLALSAQILEILRLEQSLSNPETPRDCILNEIAARQSIFAEVQSQIAALKTRQNELLPIHRLPVEILAISLSTALPLSDYHKRRTNLLLVCRTWADVINTNPSAFWTTLSTEDPPSQYDRLLQKSQQMPVTVYLNYQSANRLPSGKFMEDVRSKHLAPREIVFAGYESTPIEEVLKDCLLAPPPHLRSLDIQVGRGWGLQSEDSNSQYARVNSSAAPNLTSIRFSGVYIPWNSGILRDLRSLSLECLFSHSTTGNSPTLRELVGILHGCPDLRSLTLRYITFSPEDRQEAPTTIFFKELMTINLLDFPTCDILQYIQYPCTAAVSVSIQDLGRNHERLVDLGLLVLRLTQNRIIFPFHLKLNRPQLTLSAIDFQFTIPISHEERESTYNKFFPSLGAPTLTAVASLHMDSPASQNSIGILTAANEFLPNLTKLSISPYRRLKSKKPWHVVLEKVVQSSEQTQRPTYLCPKVTSLEITAASQDRLDLPSILQLVRTRSSEKKSKGREVEKSPITSISINLQSGKLSSEQLGVLNTLKQVTDVHWLSSMQEDSAQNESDDVHESDPSSS